MRGLLTFRAGWLLSALVLAVVAGWPGATAGEPAGDVAAASAGRPTTRLVALGDSVPAGTACGCQGFVGLLARPPSPAAPGLRTRSFAEPGLTTPGLLGRLSTPEVADALAGADVIVVLVGANDFDSHDVDSQAVGAATCAPVTAGSCYRDLLLRLSTALSQVVGQIRAMTRARHPRLLLLGYWNVFLDGAVARRLGPGYVQGTDSLTRAVDDVIRRCALAGGGRFVDLYEPFKGDGSVDDTDLLAADGDHPNAAGHRLIAAVVRRALAAP